MLYAYSFSNFSGGMRGAKDWRQKMSASSSDKPIACNAWPRCGWCTQVQEQCCTPAGRAERAPAQRHTRMSARAHLKQEADSVQILFVSCTFGLLSALAQLSEKANYKGPHN